MFGALVTIEAGAHTGALATVEGIGGTGAAGITVLVVALASGQLVRLPLSSVNTRLARTA